MSAPRRGLAVGCGGTLGFAWSAVLLAAAERALEWDARTADALIGTSAGAELVATLGAGRTTADVLAALDGRAPADSLLGAHVLRHPGAVPPRPAVGFPGAGLCRAGLRTRQPYTLAAGLLPIGRGDAGWLRAYGDALAGPHGWTEHQRTRIVATDTVTGNRVAFGGPDAPPARLGEAIAASWAIPGWFPPVEIAGRGYLDGGSVSSVSADLLCGLELDEVIVLAPMTSRGGAPGRGLARAERILRAQMTKGLDREIAMLEAAGTRVIRIEPAAADLQAMGANFMRLRHREATLATARHTAEHTVAEALVRGRVRQGA